MANRLKQNYYSNPAFSQQSEFCNSVQLSQIVQNVRQSPVGAQTPMHYYDNGTNIVSTTNQQDSDEGQFDEQEFYEEMLVDDSGIVREKKVLVLSSQNHEQQTVVRPPKSRYEYIPMQEQNARYMINQRKPTNHRYTIIETNNQEIEQSPINYHRYEYIDDSPGKQPQHRYEYIQYEPPSPKKGSNSVHLNNNTRSTATQKLHELLMTPKCTPRKFATTIQQPPQVLQQQQQQQQSPPKRDPFVTPKKQVSNLQYVKKPKVQQKLNYTITARDLHQEQQGKRHTAIVPPMCSSPIQSVYSETTYADPTDYSKYSYYHKKPTQITLAVAAVMMMLCGGVTSGLCFYMVSIMGRLYFLEFGIVAGFTCLTAGLLGFRTRNCYWLPNRNYISGYIILSVLSLLMCAGLLMLLVMQPKPGTPLADMTSGAVCGISVLSLVLACVGVMTSYCCKYPPPDNRVRHNAPGFTV